MKTKVMYECYRNAKLLVSIKFLQHFNYFYGKIKGIEDKHLIKI